MVARYSPKNQLSPAKRLARIVGSPYSPIALLALIILFAAPIGRLIHNGIAAPQQLHASNYLADIRNRALLTAGVMIGLDAIVSTIQETEIGVEFIGKVSVPPGALLDPLNDLLEFSTKVMLLCAVSLEMQRLLVSIGSPSVWKWGIIFIGGILLALAVARLGRRNWKWPERPPIVRSLCRVASFVSVAMIALILFPPLILGSIPFVASRLNAVYSESMHGLERYSDQVEDADPADIVRDSNLLERIERDIARMLGHLVNIIFVFAMEIVILPLLFLIAAWVICKRLLGVS